MFTGLARKPRLKGYLNFVGSKFSLDELPRMVGLFVWMTKRSYFFVHFLARLTSAVTH